MLVRLVVVMATPDYRPDTDPADYERIAVGLAHSGDFPGRPAGLPGPSAYRPPLYPAFLAGVFSVAPDDARRRDWAQAAQALLGTLSVLLVGIVAMQLTRRRSVAHLAMGIAALWPPLWLYANAFLSETLMVPLVLGALAAALRWRATPQLRWVVLCGLLTGLAALTRVNALALLLPLTVALWGAAPARRRLGPPAALLAATALTVAPWTIRNAIVLDHFVPVTTEDGYTLAGTYNDVARAQTRFPAAWVAWYLVPSNQRAIAGVPNTEVAWGDALRSPALEYAADHPGYVAKVGWWNLRRVFDAAGIDWLRLEFVGNGLPAWMATVEMATLWPVLALGVLGLLLAWRRRRERWLLLVPVVLLLPVLMTGYARFRAPIDPLIAIAAAGAGVAITARRSAAFPSPWRSRPEAPGTAGPG